MMTKWIDKKKKLWDALKWAYCTYCSVCDLYDEELIKIDFNLDNYYICEDCWYLDDDNDIQM